jgi:hypothetical protein
LNQVATQFWVAIFFMRGLDTRQQFRSHDGMKATAISVQALPAGLSIWKNQAQDSFNANDRTADFEPHSYVSKMPAVKRHIRIFLHPEKID